MERTGAVPPDVGREIQTKVKALGFYAPNIPEEWGGGGLDHLTFTLLERELGRAAMALTVWWGRPSNILCACNDEQTQRYLLPCRSAAVDVERSFTVYGFSGNYKLGAIRCCPRRVEEISKDASEQENLTPHVAKYCLH